MKRSTKAVLISALVFPGLGHVYLRKYLIGFILICLAGWSVYSVMATSIETALDVVTELEAGNIALNAEELNALMTQQSTQAVQLTDIPMWVLMVSWVVAMFDSYRVGRLQDQS